MTKNKTLKPFLKWAGGKRQLLDEINKHVPNEYGTYIEPFAGAGAVLFDLQPKKAIINDVNPELINVYKVVKNNIDDLIEDLKKHKCEKEYYYDLRNIDRTEEYDLWSDVLKASRFICLNKLCFNGLWRVNSKGQYNVPFSNMKNVTILHEESLRDAHKFLSKNDIKIFSQDYESILDMAQKGDFIYLDPPYDLVTDTSFITYTSKKFDREEQERVKENFDKLTAKGCKVLLSNSATDYILEAYKDYDIHIVKAKRFINSKGNERGYVNEVLIKNY